MIHLNRVILLSKGEISVEDWLDYLLDECHWKEVTHDLANGTIVILTGRHGHKDGKIGDKDDDFIEEHENMVKCLKDNYASDIEQRKLSFETVNVDRFYDSNDTLDIGKLGTEVRRINPLIILITICYAEKLDLRFAMEFGGIFPEVRLTHDLRMISRGKQVKLDEIQSELLCKMALPENIEKVAVIHGPEGSGKTILALEIAKMKVFHYLKKERSNSCHEKVQTMGKVRVLFCGIYSGEDRVPLLMRQILDETKCLKELCHVEFKPLGDINLSSPYYLQDAIQNLLQNDSEEYFQTVIMMDELFPQFTTDLWTSFVGMPKVDFVFALRHAFNDGLCLWKYQRLFRKRNSYQEYMNERRVEVENTIVYCYLRISYRCTKEAIEFVYHALIHSPSEQKLYKKKSFVHTPESLSGAKPLWAEVPSIDVFLQFATKNEIFKDCLNVMIIYDSGYQDKRTISKLRRHCSTQADGKWKLCQANTVMGSEASMVVIYDMEKLDFEAVSRAQHQLIFVTTPSNNGPLVKTLTDVSENYHDDDTCKHNCYKNGNKFNHVPHNCTYYNNDPRIGKLLKKVQLKISDYPSMSQDESEETTKQLLEFADLAFILEDMELELELSLRSEEDISNMKLNIEQMGLELLESKIIHEKTKNLEFYLKIMCKVNASRLMEAKLDERDMLEFVYEKRYIDILNLLITAADTDDKFKQIFHLLMNSNISDKEIQKCFNAFRQTSSKFYQLIPKIKDFLDFVVDKSMAMLTTKESILDETEKKEEHFLMQWIEINPFGAKDMIFRGKTLLDYAVQNGYLSLFKLLIQPLKDINCMKKSGRTQLHEAARFGHLNIIQFMMELITDKNPQSQEKGNWNKSLPIHFAARQGHLTTVQYLLQWLEGDINPAMGNGRTVLHLAAKGGHLEIVSLYTRILTNSNPGMLSTDESKGQTPLHAAAEKGRIHIVEHFCAFLSEKNPPDQYGITPLHLASFRGKLNVVKKLMHFVGNKLPFTPNGITPLHSAAIGGRMSVIEYLIQFVDDINPSLYDGKTVLHLAAESGHLNIVTFYSKLLKDYNPGQLSDDEYRGRTPLHYSAQYGHVNVVKFLCGLLSRKNPPDTEGVTPLHMAAISGHLEVVVEITQFTINKNPKSGSYWNYKTPLDWAKEQGRIEVVNYLENVLSFESSL